MIDSRIHKQLPNLKLKMQSFNIKARFNLRNICYFYVNMRPPVPVRCLLIPIQIPPEAVVIQIKKASEELHCACN